MLKARKKIGIADISFLAQFTILGFVIGELWFFSQELLSIFCAYIYDQNASWLAIASSLIFILVGTIIIVERYVYIRGGYHDLYRLAQAKLIDLLAFMLVMVVGLSVSILAGGVGTPKYHSIVHQLPPQQIILIVSIPLLIALTQLLRTLISNKNKEDTTPFFINDQPIKNSENDLLELREKAFRFAERVLNGGSTDSLVFGVDAPWGTGKSSFINFCCEYWEKTSLSRPIVHRFEPLRYKDNTDLVDKFVTELVTSIQNYAFLPSIESLLTKYLRLIRGKSEFSLLGIKFDFEVDPGAVEETLRLLEARLSELNRKIVIVVDDLDRLSWSEVKDILFAIKRSFMLPNVSYVLCYDTENLSTLANKEYDEANKVQEFLEKFVNVKIGIFLDPDTLANFVSSNIKAAVNNNLQLDVRLLDQIKETLEALVDIYKSPEYVFYQDFLGDIRKIKRLINTVMLFEIQNTDFINSDFNKHDLIHLLLIYINYPNIFRKIYNSETGDKCGFFSLIIDHEQQGHNNKFINSDNYTKYLELLDENQKFILNKIFLISESVIPNANDSESETHCRARFNGIGSPGRNLERYLNLIVKATKQNKRDAYQFYINKKNELISGVQIGEIFEGNDFSFSQGDFSRIALWRVIANSSIEIHKKNVGSNVIQYLLEHLPEYSILDHRDVGDQSRTSLIYSLLKLLNDTAWNSDTTEITEWIFGEGKHTGSGILDILSQSDRGPLGLFDLLLFRLYCSADRGNSLFNIHKAIALHSNPTAPTVGITTEIAKHGMREISQRVFQIFYLQYVKSEINIFEAINKLTIDDFVGKSAKFVQNKISTGAISEVDVTLLIEIEKSHLKSFTVYQLGNSMISSGVGCGYYDETGNNDNKGIAKLVNKYLFEFCFNPSIDKKNYENFLDYLLLNFAHSYDSYDGVIYKPNVSEFTKVLDIDQLKQYWMSNQAVIKSLKFESKDKLITNGSYTATYKNDLKDVYIVLDKL